MSTMKRILSILLVLAMLTAIFAGCSKQDETSSSNKPSGNNVVSENEKVEDILPDYTKDVAEKKEINEETVGWVEVPYTTISDVVVQSKKDNQYYLRVNFDLEYELQGVYYNDYRVDFGDGTRENLPINNVVYGHSLTDNPESENYDVKFAPLHKFRDIKFAAENPYIFYSTEAGNYVYEIFAVFESNSSNAANPYNKGNAEKGTFHDVVRDEVIPRSYYDYGVEITDEDKFITLSTCIYITEDGTVTNYPNTEYRYAIMGRLIEEDSPLIESLDLAENEDRIIDPNTNMNV